MMMNILMSLIDLFFLGIKYEIIKIGNDTYKFAQNSQGLLPKILIHLLNSRSIAKGRRFS